MGSFYLFYWEIDPLKTFGKRREYSDYLYKLWI